MPQKINMFISNGNVAPRMNPNAGINYATAPSSLNSSMVGRIHSVKPGCGSCGRK